MITTIIICLTYIATLVFLYFNNKNIAEEREQLYDRIQAKDFIEYKTATEPIEPKEREREPKTWVEL